MPNKITTGYLGDWPDNQRGPYLYVPPCRDNIISIFDDLKYDRSDIDMLSGAMRRHLIERLGRLGFKQTSGRIIEHKPKDIRCIMPKWHAQGSSPFDIRRYTPKREQDYYVLTPTQTAAFFVESESDLEEAVIHILNLIKHQPINLYRIKDYLEDNERHQNFHEAIPFIREQQKKWILTEPLRRRRALGTLLA